MHGDVEQATAQRAPEPPAEATDRDGQPLPDAPLLELYRWTATARTFVKRRDWLIRLGLAKRRAGEEESDGA